MKKIVQSEVSDWRFQQILNLIEYEDIIVSDPLPRASQRPRPNQPSRQERGESSRRATPIDDFNIDDVNFTFDDLNI